MSFIFVTRWLNSACFQPPCKHAANDGDSVTAVCHFYSVFRILLGIQGPFPVQVHYSALLGLRDFEGRRRLV